MELGGLFGGEVIVPAMFVSAGAYQHVTKRGKGLTLEGSLDDGVPDGGVGEGVLRGEVLPAFGAFFFSRVTLLHART